VTSGFLTVDDETEVAPGKSHSHVAL